jgi:UDP-N-acetylmuramyl pentapeptide phosphotransferase/UDP-N-acetylglucosamine-1-phosphate transferase
LVSSLRTTHFGRIFLGDAGAYLLGHTLCWIAKAILTLRPDIPTFAILLIFFWPVADTLLAIWRRKSNRTTTDQPDRLHFHQLVMRYLEIRFLGRQKRRLSSLLTLIVLAPMLLSPQALGFIYAYDHQKQLLRHY